MTKAVFQLEPLTCPSCTNKIETALSKIKGVSNAKVLFNSGKVKAEFDGGVVQVDELANVIQNLGYPVTNTKVS